MAFILKLIVLTILIILINGDSNNTKTEILAGAVPKQHINGYCDITKNCTHNTICVDNHCRCRPNHRWNNNNCEKYDCTRYPNECNSYDPHRECTSDYSLTGLLGKKCTCEDDYIEDPHNHKCRKYCHNNYQCDFNIDMVCTDFLCQCKPNYKWNTTSNRCENFNCTKDSECWGNGDENRECYEGTCVCNYQEDLVSMKCYLTFYSLFRWKNYHTRKETLLICTLLIIPTVLGCCIYSYYRKRRRIVNNVPAPYFTKEQLNINFNYPTKNNIAP